MFRAVAVRLSAETASRCGWPRGGRAAPGRRSSGGSRLFWTPARPPRFARSCSATGRRSSARKCGARSTATTRSGYWKTLGTAIAAGQLPRQPARPTAYVVLGALEDAAMTIATAEDPLAARSEMGRTVTACSRGCAALWRRPAGWARPARRSLGRAPEHLHADQIRMRAEDGQPFRRAPHPERRAPHPASTAPLDQGGGGRPSDEAVAASAAACTTGTTGAGAPRAPGPRRSPAIPRTSRAPPRRCRPPRPLHRPPRTRPPSNTW